jgi:Ca2+-transporting ATPase
MRSTRDSIFAIKSHNKFLYLAAAGSLLLTTLVCEIPFIAGAFGFASVGIVEYLIAAALGVCVIPVVEIVKLIQRAIARKKENA